MGDFEGFPKKIKMHKVWVGNIMAPGWKRLVGHFAGGGVTSSGKLKISDFCC